MSVVAGFGKPKYKSGEGTQSNFWNVKEGDNIYRILPPMKSLADEGRWAIYVSTHFGYKGVNEQDPSRGRMRTFKCIEDRDYKTKMVNQDCPACDAIAEMENRIKQREAELKAQGTDEEEAQTALAPMKAWLKDHNCDRKWHLNVMTRDGQFGVLKINHKSQKKQLDALINELLEKEGVDALDLSQGVWFNFKRTGRQLQAIDQVLVVKNTVEVDAGGKKIRAEVTAQAPLTEEQASAALQQCPDLATIGTTLTYDQIKGLVESGEDPEMVDAIFNQAQRRPDQAANTAKSTTTKLESAAAKPEPAKSVDTAKLSDDQKAVIERRKAEIAAKKEAEAKAKAEAEKVQAPANPADLSDEDFEKLYGGV